MTGDLGGNLEWTERLTDRDWSHYYGQNKGDTVVVFFDGIEVPAKSWWCENLKGRFGRQVKSKIISEEQRSRSRSRERRQKRQSMCGSPMDMTEDHLEDDNGLLNQDIWGSLTPLRREGSVHSHGTSRGREPSISQTRSPNRSVSTPKRLSRYLDYDQRESSASKDPTRRVLSDPTHHIHFSISPPRTRFLEPEPLDRRPSSAVTVSPSSSIKGRKGNASGDDSRQTVSRPSSILQRRKGSPVLRHTS